VKGGGDEGAGGLRKEETRCIASVRRKGYERGKTGVKHLKTKSMENISIKDHPPWYARGTPITNTRDGPPMAINDKLLFANPITIGCRGSSGEGRGGGKGQGGSQQAAVGSWQSEDTRLNEIIGQGRQKTEDRRRRETKGKTRSWLTLNTTFFSTQKRLYGRRCALVGRKCVNACPTASFRRACPKELVQAGGNAIMRE
jgi:hypothetical protein